MAKDPAFLFYPNDWIGGTMGMTFEEKGAYMELLMTQFNRGHMTTHMIGQLVGQIFDKLQDKFKKDENGLWYNERLEQEKIKRQKYTKSRRNNISGENQHTKKSKNNEEKISGHMSGHMTSHMENENINTFNSLSSNKYSNEIKDSNSWDKEKKLFKNDEAYFYNICTEFKLTKEQIDKKIDEFIKQQELAQDYKIVKELKRHFLHWIKKHKNEIPKTPKTTYQVYTPKDQW